MKILIIKASSLGDIIHVFPVLSYLRHKFPTSQIDWIVEKPFLELIEAHPEVTRAIPIETKVWRRSPLASREAIRAFRTSLDHYDYAFDLQGNLKSSFLLTQVHAKKKIGFGWKTVPEFPNLLFTHQKINPPKRQNIRDDYLAVVKTFFKDEAPFTSSPIELRISDEEREALQKIFRSPVTLVCPGAAWPNKRLSLEGMAKVLKQLNRGPYFFIWGSKEEQAFVQELAKEFEESRVLERMSLPALQHAMSLSKLVIAMDSLPLHLCGTTATPSISFFGPSSARKYAPIGLQHQAFQGECPYGIKFEKRCPKLRSCPTGKCLTISHEELSKRSSNTSIR